MAPTNPRLRILSVGGNSVSAFLSWRLQATNACDVTLVWKSGYETVAQYGLSFKSKMFGNERFKPHAVVRSPEEASQNSRVPFDYVLLCVKALPDVYDLASIVESVVSPQHTCILINTTNSLGIETYLEQRFPTNVVLSLVSGAELAQLGVSDFEHNGATDIWVGPANKNPQIPQSIQSDMAEALAMTLSSGSVDCRVSENIRQQQYERMIGPIAFHPASVVFETPNHKELLAKTGVNVVVYGVIDELLQLARSSGCQFPDDYREQLVQQMVKSTDTQSIMFQDFLARRPMEVETYLGSPLKLAQSAKVPVPRIEMLYAMLHNININNQTRHVEADIGGPNTVQPPPRMSSAAQNRPPPQNGAAPPAKNGMPRPNGSRAPSVQGPPPAMRRGPSSNGYPPRGQSNGYPPNGQLRKRPSMEGNDLEEFSHLMLYDTAPDSAYGGGLNGVYNDGLVTGSTSDLALRERELMIRQKELALREREQELSMGSKRRGGQRRAGGDFDDDDDDDDYFDPMEPRPGQAPVDDNFDMMSVTSRRNRRAGRPSIDANGMGVAAPRGGYGRPGTRTSHRTSARVMQDLPGLHNSIMNDALLGYSSNRYGSVDRAHMGSDSRTASLTAARLDELQRNGGSMGGGAYPSMSRRTSQSRGVPMSPGLGPRPPGQRPSPPNGYAPHMNGANGQRPSPPGGNRQPMPARGGPGAGSMVAAHQVDQYAGVSNLYPPPKKNPQVRSLTGSASASAASGDSGIGAHVESGQSAHSSSSSFAPRIAPGIRT